MEEGGGEEENGVEEGGMDERGVDEEGEVEKGVNEPRLGGRGFLKPSSSRSSVMVVRSVFEGTKLEE